MKITELEFYVMTYPRAWQRGQRLELVPYNIFQSTRVMRSVAMWIVGKALEGHNFLRWCFGDLDGQTEWEILVSSWPSVEGQADARKFSIFDLYIRPNEKLLKGMIDEVDAKSAEAWLKQNKK